MASVSGSGEDVNPLIIQYYLDTRKLWQVPGSITGTKNEVQQLKTTASREMSLLSEAEQVKVLKFYHLRDAKMSLASHLLKHFIVAKYCSIPWSQTDISRDSNGKPCFNPVKPGDRRIDFNVSHQAGIVTLIAAVGFKQQVDVGTDVVCWNERSKYDYDHVDRSGLFDWIDMHADVFATTEIEHMKFGSLDLNLRGWSVNGYGKDAIARCEKRGGSVEIKVMEDGREITKMIGRDIIVDAKLRRFYAMWCLREAYVKMTGEALLAEWLQDLQILDVQAPKAKPELKGDEVLEEGEVLRDFKILIHGKNVSDVEMEITAFGANFMIAGAMKRPHDLKHISNSILGKWQELMAGDILDFAEKQT